MKIARSSSAPTQQANHRWYWRVVAGMSLLLCFSVFAAAQQQSAPPPKKQSPAPKQEAPPTPTQLNNAVKSPTEVEEGAGFQKAREEWFLEGRRLPDGAVGAAMRLKAVEHLDRMIEAQRQMGLIPLEGAAPLLTGFPGPTSWTEIGPMPINVPGSGFPFNGGPFNAGRVAAIAVDPKNKDIAYLGAAAGGVWKTTNAGATWTPMTDNQPSLSTGSIAIDPTSASCGASGPCQIIYVGTGEQNFSADSYSGAGILKSINGGTDWTQLGAGVFVGPFSSHKLDGAAHIGALAVDPAPPSGQQVILAGVFRLSSSALSGIWRSTDGGTTWTQVLTGGAGTGIAFDPVNPGVVYAAIGSSFSNPANGVYRSADHGANWTKMTGSAGNPFPTSGVGRISLDIAASSPTTLFALIANSSGTSQLGLFKTINANLSAAADWVPQAVTPDVCTSAGGSQCSYDLIVRVSPTDPTLVYAGGSSGDANNSRALFRSIDGGASWSSVSNGQNSVGLHVDLHALAFSSDGTRLYIGNDGGSWRSDDPAAAPGPSYTNLNSTLGITMTYPGHGINFSDENSMFVGTQDNGSQRYSGSKAWNLVTGGDGGQTAEDERVPSVVYTTCQFICIFRSITDGTPGTFSFITNGIAPERSKFIAPIAADPGNPGVVYFGTFRLYQTTTFAELWKPISGDLSAGAPPLTGAISAIAVSRFDSNIVYVGAQTSKSSVSTLPSRIWKTTNALSSSPIFADATGTGLPPRAVTSLAVDRNNPNIVYATFGGFSGFSDSAGHVFRTADGGNTWVDVSGTGVTGLPNVPANDVLPDPDIPGAAYVATDVGVFRTGDATQGAGTVWSPVPGLPKAIVFSLNGRGRSRIVRASTSGRGTWIIQDLNISIPANQVLLPSMKPSAATAGALGVTLTLDGANFTVNSKAQWDGSQTVVTTTFVSSTQLTATIGGSLLTAGSVGVHKVTVFEPSLTNPVSDGLRFSVLGGPPTISSLNPTSAVAGGASFSLTVNGTGFNCSSQQGVGTVIFFRGVPHTPTVIPPCSPTSLRIAVDATEIAFGGDAGVTAFTPPPAGGNSSPFSFPITAPPPSNDNFAAAINASPTPFTDAKDSSGATTEVGEPVPPGTCTLGESANTHSIWYKFMPTTTGSVTADTNGTFYDSVLQAVTQTVPGPIGNFSPVACADNFAAGHGETVTFTATAGTTYFFMISDFNGVGGQTVFHLTTGVPPSGPVVTFSPTTGNFGNQAVGTTSSAQSATLTNTGGATLNLGTVMLTGPNASEFTPTGATTCTNGLALTAAQSCILSATFTPSAPGSRIAGVTITDNAAGSPHTFPLGGTGIAPAISFGPSNVDFGSVAVGSASAPADIKLSNSGTATLNVTSITPGGFNLGDFPLGPPVQPVAACNLAAAFTLAPGQVCGFIAKFAPAASGVRNATVTIADNAAGNPHTVSLTGTGTGTGGTGTLSLNPTSGWFCCRGVATTSGVQQSALSNSGRASVTITNIQSGGANPSDFAGATPSVAGDCGNGTVLAGSTPGNSCNLRGTFTPTAVGARSATLTITATNSTNSPVLNLSGTGIFPAVTLAPTNLSFGTQRRGTTSAPQNGTLTNSGTDALNLTAPPAITGANAADFAIVTAGTTCANGTALNANANCTWSVTFTPTTTGARSASLTFTDDATGSPHSVPLTGTGTFPAVTLAPTSVNFGSQRQGTTSTAQNGTVTNSGTDVLHLTAPPAITGANAADFAIVAAGTTCANGTALNANANCTWSVTFTPTTTGARSASLTFTDDATGSPHSVPLSGTGVTSAIGFSPTMVNFNNVVVGGSSAPTHVHITNSGTATLNIISIALTGADAAQFTLTSAADGATPACPLGASGLAPTNMCNVDAKFGPTSTGTKNANFSVTDDAPGSPQAVPLTGTGTASTVVFNPSSVNFSNQRVGTSSAATHVHITNGGTATLNITSIMLTGTDTTQFTLTSAADGPTPACLLGASNLTPTNTCNVDAKFGPTSTGAKSASMTVTDDAAGSPHSVPLTGMGIAPAVTLNPANVAFGSVLVGTSSNTTNVQLTNSGSDTLNLTSITLTGTDALQFSLVAPTGGATPACPTGAGTVNVGSSCFFGVQFAPTTAGAKSASASITDDATPSPQSVPLTGTGFIAPKVSLNPASVNFNNQRTGTTSAATNVTLSNTGNDVLNITSIGLTGADAAQFNLLSQANGATPACPLVASTLNPNGACNFAVNFAPTTTGAKNAIVSIADDAPGNPHSVPLNGTGTAPAVTLTPTNVAFGGQNIGTTGAVTNVTLTNSGTATLNLTSITLGGTDAAQFSLLSQANGATPACPLGASALNAGNACNFALQFAPTTTGAKSASVSIADDATGSPQSVPLSGTGTQPGVTLSANNVAFGSVNVGDTKAASPAVTLTNSGTGPLTITGISLTGADAAQFTLANTCGTLPATIPASGTCTITPSFKPTSTGAKSASVSIADNAPGNPHTVALTGNSVDFALAVPTATVTVTAGQPAEFTINLTTTGTGGTANAVTFSASGNPAATTVTFNPASIPAGSTSGTTKMTVATTAHGAVPPQGPSHLAGTGPLPLLLGLTAALAALASLALLRQGARTRRWALYLPLALLALVLAGVMGCSNARMPTGTPTGSFPITVTATSGGVAKPTIVTLIVN